MTHTEKSARAIQLLKSLAQKHNLTHTQIGEHIGLPQQSVSQFFSGEHQPRLDSVFRVLGAINELAGTEYGLKDLEA